MHVVKKAAGHIRPVIKGMLFIGFSIQIVLGLAWMCCNFFQVQGFGEPDSWYGRLFGLLGGKPCVMYAVQLLAAFLAGCFFLQRLQPAGKGLAIWRGLALLTFPFAMQCHLAIQPYSLMGSLFLTGLLCLLETRRGRAGRLLALAAVCAAGMLLLSGAADGDRRAEPGYSFAGAVSSRFAWPTVWNDRVHYPQELQDMTADIAWNASICPDNMKLFWSAVEEQAGTEAAKSYYLQMAKVAWDCHASVIVRQIGWDVLGYAVSPVIFQRQMAGDAYASYSGRNYEVMREKTPIVTRDFVDYGCWWFGCGIALALLLAIGDLLSGERRLPRKRQIVSVTVCAGVSGILVALLAMRGAGRMDYRLTAAIGELWLCWPLFAMGRSCPERMRRLW